MELNINFDKSLEKTINSFQPLADWFERNQETMAYFELTKKGCLHFENSHASYDIITLGRMANAGLTCLESKLQISPEDKAKFAAFSIANIYEEQKEGLSNVARIQYYLDIETLQKEENTENKQYQKRKKINHNK